LETMSLGVESAASHMTHEQRRVFEKIRSGPRGSVPAPFLTMLDAPLLADAIQEVGAVLRFQSVLSPAHRETAILSTAGALSCGYEWRCHAALAAATGVPAGVIAATLSDDTANIQDTSLAAIVRLCRSISLTHAVPAFVLRSAVARFGPQATSELIAIVGYYAMLANFLKCAAKDEPLPTQWSR